MADSEARLAFSAQLADACALLERTFPGIRVISLAHRPSVNVVDPNKQMHLKLVCNDAERLEKVVSEAHVMFPHLAAHIVGFVAPPPVVEPCSVEFAHQLVQACTTLGQAFPDIYVGANPKQMRLKLVCNDAERLERVVSEARAMFPLLAAHIVGRVAPPPVVEPCCK